MLLLLLDSLFFVTIFTGGYAFCVATIPVSSQLTSTSSPLTSTKSYDIGTDRLSSKDDKFDSFPTIRSKVFLPSPTINNLFSRLTYSWVNELMKKGNNQVLELEDVWLLKDSKQMNATSSKFDHIFDQQKNGTITGSSSSNNSSITKFNNLFLLKDFWTSPITRAIVIMYKRQFIETGLLRLINTLIQFLPSLIIARLLRHIEFSKTITMSSIKACISTTNSISSITNQPIDIIIRSIVYYSRCICTNQGFQLSMLLFTVLTLKTAVENQYFDYITQLSADIRGTLSTAIYKKSLKLSPTSRRSYSMGEIVNYMQIDTGRLEYAAGTIHTVWDGVLQIAGYTFLLLRFLGKY